MLVESMHVQPMNVIGTQMHIQLPIETHGFSLTKKIALIL